MKTIITKLRVLVICILFTFLFLTTWKYKGLYNTFILPSINRSESKLAELDTISLEFDADSWKKLSLKRKEVLSKGVYEKDKNDYVDLNFNFLNESLKAKARLKGDLLDHFEGDRWSLRVKMSGDNTFKGVKKFSIQDPKTRKYIHEWIFQQLLIHEGLLGVKYDFISVFINNKNKGVYAFEEHFDKKYVKNRRLKKSYVLKFDETEYWNGYSLNKNDFETFDNKMFLSSKIKSYTNTDKDSLLNYSFKQDVFLIEQIKLGKVKFNEVFDAQKWSKYMALIDLVGGHHGFRWNNVRLLKNGDTELIEPIGYDSNSGTILKDLLVNDFKAIPKSQSYFFFTDDVKKLYYKELKRYSNQEYLNVFFKKISKDLSNKLKCIYINNPEFIFEKEIYYQNQTCIEQHLNLISSND